MSNLTQSDPRFKLWLQNRWQPFVDELEDAVQQVQAKSEVARGLDLKNQDDINDGCELPPEAQFTRWARKAVALTEEIRGKGNGSPNIVFHTLMRMSCYDGVARYKFDQVPQKRSPDGFLRVIDGEVRGSFYGHAPPPPSKGEKGLKRDSTSALDSLGNLTQNVKDSAIANTTITGLMRKDDAVHLVLGSLFRSCHANIMRMRGMQFLKRILEALKEGSNTNSNRSFPLIIKYEECIRRVLVAAQQYRIPATDDRATVARLVIDLWQENYRQRKEAKSNWKTTAGFAADGETLVGQAHAKDGSPSVEAMSENALKPLGLLQTKSCPISESSESASTVASPANDKDGKRSSYVANCEESEDVIPGLVEFLAKKGAAMSLSAKDKRNSSAFNFFKTRACKTMAYRGMVPFKFSHMDPETKVHIQQCVYDFVREQVEEMHENGTIEPVPEEIADFVKFVRQHPGSVYNNDEREHHRMLFLCQFQKGVTFLKHSRMENFTKHRFLPVVWRRILPLCEGLDQDAESNYKMVRSGGSVELARFRRNAFPYDDSHSIGLATPANIEDVVADLDGYVDSGLFSWSDLGKNDANHAKNSYGQDLTSIMAQHLQRKDIKSVVKIGFSRQDLGEVVINDKNAKLGNWYTIDVEKLLTEFVMMNPRNPGKPVLLGMQKSLVNLDDVLEERGQESLVKDDDGNVVDLHNEDVSVNGRIGKLPGESYLMIGQNPRAASSIGVTQHTQLAEATTEKWPIFSLGGDPENMKSRKWYRIGKENPVRVSLQIVQIGNEHKDASVLRVETENVTDMAHPHLIKLLHGMRIHFMDLYGGRKVDFNLLVAAEEKPGVHGAPAVAVCLFNCLAPVVPHPERKYVYLNPQTRESSGDSGFLPVQTVDASQGKGNFMVWGEDAWKICTGEEGEETGRGLLGRLYDFTRLPGSRDNIIKYLKNHIEDFSGENTE